MNTEFENMALLNIEDYNELKAKAEATDEQIKKQNMSIDVNPEEN